MSLSKIEIATLVKEKSDRIQFEKPKGKSQVWAKFRMVAVDGILQNFAICLSCHYVYTFNVRSTSGLSRHKCPSDGKAKIDHHFFPNVERKPSQGSAMKKELTEAIVGFCANDMRPFSIVEGQGFRKLCQALIRIGAQYGNVSIEEIMPCRASISNYVQSKYNEMQDDFAQIQEHNTSRGMKRKLMRISEYYDDSDDESSFGSESELPTYMRPKFKSEGAENSSLARKM